MNPDALRRQVARDRDQGEQPFLVVGTAGTVGTGAVDPLTRTWHPCAGNMGCGSTSMAPTARLPLTLRELRRIWPH